VAYWITDACIACGDCSVACSQKAIIETGSSSKTGGENSYFPVEPADGRIATEFAGRLTPFYYITGGCNECGSCLEVCPAGAIVWED